MLPHVDAITPVVAPVAGHAVSPRQEMEKPAYAAPPHADAKSKKPPRQNAAEEMPARERGDQVEIHFTLSHEEREAFATALSSREGPAGEMTEEEKQLVRKASERITKFIDATITRNRQNREKVEKAVSEWYSKISRDEPRGPFDLIQLLREAAMGNLDEVGEQ